ncbi:MAG: tRNA modification GTPase [Candidatus Poribacteria bacterium]|nr:tRNA modification GTPase [Candidatus Poribacteria bacterium]
MDDTISAISTPRGEGGIGIVRLSGPSSLIIMDKIFLPRHKKSDKTKSHRITYGHVVDPDTGERIDEVLVSAMLAPNTYTREDVAEINCHGGSISLSKILELTLRMGARLAGPGEFTKRAFLNGRIDLAQAEAVADIIRARTDLSLKVAIGQLEGHLSKKINQVRTDLISLLASVEVSIDFPDEELDFITSEDIIYQIANVSDKLNIILSTAEDGRIITEGIKGVIVGKPNVGKSSLFNALLKEDRAIVTSIPGTTRDPIEEFVNLNGVPLKLTDTAGIHETDDVIEVESIDRTKAHLDQADMILMVLDGSDILTDDDRHLISLVFNQTQFETDQLADKRTIIVVNKADLPQMLEKDKLASIAPNIPIACVSTVDESGLHDLKSAIREMVLHRDSVQADPVFVTKAWQKNAIRKAMESLQYALESIQVGMSTELIAVDLRGALNSLGEITGENASQEILDQIFARFCIGK